MSTNSTLTPSTVLRRMDDTLSSPVDDDMVLLHIPNGKFYGFDDISRRVWELIEQPCPIGRVCDQLMQEFQVDRETCERDILKLAGTLVDAELVEKVAA